VERRKYIGRVKEDYVKSFSSRVVRVDENGMAGYVSLTEIREVHRPFIVGNLCLYDNGYSELCYIPDGENWALFAIYDSNGEIVEWYIDITRKNAADDEGNPYCDDLYLDVALLPDGSVLVLDEDELKSALDRGDISRQDYDMAYAVLNDIKSRKILDTAYMESLCTRLLSLF